MLYFEMLNQVSSCQIEGALENEIDNTPQRIPSPFLCRNSVISRDVKASRPEINLAGFEELVNAILVSSLGIAQVKKAR